MWGRYYPIESGPWDPKKWGLYGRSVKKCRFSGQKWAPAAAPRPAVRRSQHKKVVFLVSRNNGIKKFGRRLQKIDFGPKNSIFGQKICFFLRYTHITPLFWARTDPTQWDHNFPTSWGNSGYLRFSGKCLFDSSAGRFLAPIAQNGPFWAKNAILAPSATQCPNWLQRGGCVSQDIYLHYMIIMKICY